MLNTKSFLCLDFGAGSLKVAEFEPNEAGTLRLKQFGLKPLGFEGSQEAARERVILKAIQELFAERPFGSKNIDVCAPGFHVFSKFVKLPPVDTSKVTQIIQYEAQQNVPFPLEEVVWDYQILGTAPAGELEVLLVAIKADVVDGLFRTAEAANLRVQLVDVSPAALCNAFRYNYGDLDGCTMLLDIGAKTSNLLFFEKGKVYSRGINIGANSITQDFAAESKLKFAEAERLKVEQGFVSLGGAYEEPDNPQQAAISKIARQVMTRLHIQVNQTIQFYRGQQGGAVPLRLFLAGGGFYAKIAEIKRDALGKISTQVDPLKQKQTELQAELDKLTKLKQEGSQLAEWMEQRFFWADLLAELRRTLMQAEAARKESMGVENGVWIESFTSTTPGLTAAPAQAQQEEESGMPSATQMMYQRLMMERYGLRPQSFSAQPETESPLTPTASTKTTPASTNEIATITVKCRGLNLKKVSPTANDDLAFAVQDALRKSPLFDPQETKLSGAIEQVDETNSVTFSFGVTLKLKHPMKL